MALPVTPVGAPLPGASLQVAPLLAPGSASGAGGAFQNLLSEAMNHVEQFQQNSQSSIDRFLSGEDEEVHTVALATQQTELAFDLFLQVRNKVISAYQEVMKMQI
jgi:flagellar hook-basal body complex protein FliE